MPNDEKYLRTQDVERMFNVTNATVASWVTKGFIEAITLPSGQRRYLRTSVEAFASTLTTGETHA